LRTDCASHSLAASDSLLYAKTLGGCDSNGTLALLSRDGGKTWETVPKSNSWLEACIALLDGIQAIPDYTGLHVSPDQGRNWTPIDMRINSILGSAHLGKQLFLLDGSGQVWSVPVDVESPLAIPAKLQRIAGAYLHAVRMGTLWRLAYATPVGGRFTIRAYAPDGRLAGASSLDVSDGGEHVCWWQAPSHLRYVFRMEGQLNSPSRVMDATRPP
jgi:hypothetical protein